MQVSEMTEQARLAGARPLFLIGAPRSGTTILANLLNAHAEVLLTNETAVFLQLNAVIEKSRLCARAGIPFGRTYRDLWAGNLRERSKRLIESYYERIAAHERRENIKYWGEKHPHLHTCLHYVSELYPEAIYIYAVRDPRDVACSIAQMNGVAVGRAVESCLRFIDEYEQFVASLAPGRVKVVRYEDLVVDYESVFSDTLRVLGLDLDEASKEYLRMHANRDAHTLGQYPPRAVDFSKRSVERWTRDMSKDEQSYAWTKFNSFMARHGYLPAAGDASQGSAAVVAPGET